MIHVRAFLDGAYKDAGVSKPAAVILFRRS
jgi:hypothetical protein